MNAVNKYFLMETVLQLLKVVHFIGLIKRVCRDIVDIIQENSYIAP